MVNFEWNPEINQTYDAEYGDTTLTKEVTLGAHPLYRFLKTDADFTLSGEVATKLMLTVDPDANLAPSANHIDWSSDTYGRVVNVVKGTLTCRGTTGAPGAFNNFNVQIAGGKYKALTLNVDGNLIFNKYKVVLFQTVDVHVRNSGSVVFDDVNSVIIDGGANDFDDTRIDIDDEASFILDAQKSISITAAHFKVNSSSSLGLHIRSREADINFDMYVGAENTKGISLINTSKGRLISTAISLDHARLYAKNNSLLEIKTDKITAKEGARFTVSENGEIVFEGASAKPIRLTGSIAASYPQKMFSFNTPALTGNACFKMFGITSGSGLSLLLAYELISLNGNTGERYLRSKLKFQDLVSDGNSYLKISLQ